MSASSPAKQKTAAPRLVHADLMAPIPASETTEIIDQLRSQATSILGAALGTTPLVSFATGGLGNFPYYWQNPANLMFNHTTYDWINANLMADASPVQQASGTNFSGLFIQALGSISYSLSSADQAILTKANQNATNQQAALLTAWKAAYGAIPPATATQQPIDIILSTICTVWASTPPTSLMAIQNAANLNALLGNTPASGKTILPVLSQYLNALSGSISLQNAVSLNNHYLAQALAAVQSPAIGNGGLATDDNLVRPSYSVTTALAAILNGLGATSNAITLNMMVSRSNSSEYSVSVNGGTAFNIPILDFFTLGVSNNSSYFQDTIATSSNSVSISMTYSGVTLVSFTPGVYNGSTGMNWFYMLPITQAIQNGTNDVSGYKFSPNPNIDFSAAGPFGLLQGVAIANYPSIVITVQSSNYLSIQETFKQSTSVGLSFLGISLGGGSVSTYSNSVSVNAAMSQVKITLTPPPALIAGASTDSVGWVLGVQTLFPAA